MTDQKKVLAILLLFLVFLCFAWLLITKHSNPKNIKATTMGLIDIDEAGPQQKVLRDRLVAQLNSSDPSSVLNVLSMVRADPALSDCHTIGHDLGHHAYALYGFAGAMFLSSTTITDLS